MNHTAGLNSVAATTLWARAWSAPCSRGRLRIAPATSPRMMRAPASMNLWISLCGGAVQHGDGQPRTFLALVSDQVVLLDGQAQVHELCGLGAGDQLLHVEHCEGPNMPPFRKSRRDPCRCGQAVPPGQPPSRRPSPTFSPLYSMGALPMTTVPLGYRRGGALRPAPSARFFRLGPQLLAASVARTSVPLRGYTVVIVVRSHRLTFEISEYTVGWLVLSSTKSPTQ